MLLTCARRIMRDRFPHPSGIQFVHSMWFSLFKRSDWRLLRAAMFGLSLVVLTLAWGITLQRLESDKEMAVELARTQQQNLAVIVSNNLEQILDGARTIAIASNEWWEGSPQAVADRLTAMRAANPAFLRISLYNAEARRVYSSSPALDDPLVAVAVSTVLQAKGTADFKGLILPQASALPEDAWYKPMLFPVGRSGSAPVGVLMVMLDLGYLLKVYRHIEFGASGIIHILTRDAHEVLEWRSEGLVLNNRKRYFATFAAQPATTSSLTTDLYQDGSAYLSSFTRAERFSFLLVVSRNMQDILARHWKTRSQALSTLGILTVIIAAGAYFIARGIGRHGELFGALLASDEKNRSLIARLEGEKGRASMLAAHDNLTGLPNRGTFNELATSYLADARRGSGHYALMYLDLDRFKLVNDTQGHHVGDLLLQTVATRLRKSLRDSDIVARLGGDEFAILLTGVSSLDNLTLVAEKIIREVSKPFEYQDGQEIQVSPSIGIAVFPRDGQDFESLCKNADAAMYESKRMGRGTYTYYHAGLNPSSERRFNLERRLPKAIAEDELVLHFQPKVRLSDFRIVGFEALVRWQHPEHGLVYPNDFIPLAEETGLIIELGEWVARACCRQQAAWQREGLECVPLAVNMSARQLQRKTLPGGIEDLLAEHGLRGDMLAVEITETVLLESLETAGMVLRSLEAMGAQISLDDFGSGFSSLGYLRTLPIHILKIDKQFIRDIRNSPHDAVLVSSIISLAHNLGMEVIAEGVETLEQLIYLKTAGCDQVQGYYFSRPVPAAEAGQLLLDGTIAPPRGGST